MYQLGCFRTGRPLCTQILPGEGRSPATILGTRKLETLGYPIVKTAFICVPSFWHNTRVCRTDERTDGRTDARICRSIHIACKASFAERCKNTRQGERRLHIVTRNAAVVGKQTTAVYAEGGRNPLFKCVSQWQK